MFKRLKRIEAHLELLKEEYYGHITKHHDKRQSRIAERNNLAKQLLVAEMTRTGNASCLDAIKGADTMMAAMYGDDWDKYDPILEEETVEKAMENLHKAILIPVVNRMHDHIEKTLKNE